MLKYMKFLLISIFLFVLSSYTFAESFYVRPSGIGIGTETPLKSLHVNGDIQCGDLINRHHLLISSEIWPEIRYQTPNDNGVIRLGVAHQDDGRFNISAGDWYVYSSDTNRMDLIVKKTGGVKIQSDCYLGNLTSRNHLKISSEIWPEIRYQTPNDNGVIRLGVAHQDDGRFNISAGDWYVYSSDTNRMDLIVKKTGGVNIATNGGNVAIGTKTPESGYKLTVDGGIYTDNLNVNGKLISSSLILNQKHWSDFVFDEDYNLISLSKLETQIKEQKHLPGIPSEADVKKNGISVGEMQAKLLQKIEELTLYVIEQNKKIEIQSKKLENQAQEIQKLKSQVTDTEKIARMDYQKKRS